MVDESDGATSHARWRRDVARPLLRAYASIDAVDAVMLGGSTARGDADRWSDVEVGIFWARQPTERERADAARAAGAVELRTLTRAESGPPWYDHAYLRDVRPKGLLVELIHTLTSEVERILDTALVRCEVDPPGLDTLRGIVDGREVQGRRAELVTGWQARAADYPRGLALAVVRRSAAIEQFWRWRMLVERDNPLLLAREFVRVSSQLLDVLHALNGRYCGHVSAYKRLDALERELPIAPLRLAARLRTVFSAEPAEGAGELRRLVDEAYDLIALHLPEVDVTRLRADFHADRRPLDDL